MRSHVTTFILLFFIAITIANCNDDDGSSPATPVATPILPTPTQTPLPPNPPARPVLPPNYDRSTCGQVFANDSASVYCAKDAQCRHIHCDQDCIKVWDPGNVVPWNACLQVCTNVWEQWNAACGSMDKRPGSWAGYTARDSFYSNVKPIGSNPSDGAE
jgi:hypothetical protein